MIAKWNNKEYKILDTVELVKASSKVSFSDLTIDFEGCTIDDLPYAQQEIKVYDKYDTLKYTGFVSSYQLPELRLANKINRNLTLTLMSPRQLTTIRTFTIITTDTLENIINSALSVMYEDGFTLKELNVIEKTVTVKYISMTIEEILSSLSDKYSLWWHIDEYKRITITSIDYLFSQSAYKTINIDNYKEIKGFISLTPSVENSDYANIINIKNARIFYSMAYDLNVTLSNGDTLTFENPVDISESTIDRRAQSENQGNPIEQMYYGLEITYNTNQRAYIRLGYTTYAGKGNLEVVNIGTDDSEDNLFTLTMDSFFTNLATGFTYNGESDITINSIASYTALRYANMKLINYQEVQNMAGVITLSGQIEKTVDVDETWYTKEELIDYIVSLFIKNDKYTNEITLNYDEDNEFEIGQLIEIELPEIFVSGTYVITEIVESKTGNEPIQYTITLKNTNLSENYIDLFRSSTSEEDESQIETEYLVEYSDREKIREILEIELANQDTHSLDFIL